MPEIPPAPVPVVDPTLSRALSERYARWLIVAAILVGLALRLLGLSQPPYGSHNFRQTQTLYTIENFYSHGIDLLHPKTIYVGYPGTFVLELPVFQGLAAALYHVFGPHVQVVRILNILLGAATAVGLYRLTSYFLNRATGVLAALIFWLAPLNVVYERSMLLDPTGVFLALLSFFCLALLLDARQSFTSPVETSASPSTAQPATTFHFLLFAVATWLTVMIKALYLWPSVLLLGYAFVARRFKLNASLLKVGIVFAVSGASFLAWNRYATQINNASPFTRGLKPTSLLGFSMLFHLDFYRTMLLRGPKMWLGLASALLYVIGLWSMWRTRHHRLQAAPSCLFLLIPPTYLLLFPNINYPHEYYQLIIAPFLAITSALGLRWVWLQLAAGSAFSPARLRFLGIGSAALLILTAPAAYCLWLRQPQLAPQLLDFELLSAGKFEPDSSAMLFVSRKIASGPVGGELPQFLYAARLWGYSRGVDNSSQARTDISTFEPLFPGLRYIVFYGTDPPNWLAEEQFVRTLSDDIHKLYIFHRP